MKSKFIIVFLLFFFNGNFFSQTLSEKIENVLKDSLFTVSQISINVYDLTNGKYIYRKNPDLVLRPASNMKLLTTAASLLYLGPKENFNTAFLYSDEIEDSILNGNIFVKGGFDPLFDVGDFDPVITKIKELGIKKINGNIYADVSNIDSLYFGKGWMWDDNPESYMPYLSSLNINKNSVKIFYQPGKVGEKSLLNFEPVTNYYSFENNLITTDEDTSNIKITRDWLIGTNHIIIEGDISYKHKLDSVSVNLTQPPFYFLELFSESLNKNEIELNGIPGLAVAKNIFDTLAVVQRSIIEVINETNKESCNLCAEMLLRKLSEEYFRGSASAEKGLRLIDSLMIKLGYNPKTFVFADGSGLSHYNLINASLLIDLLKYFYISEPELYSLLYQSLPVAGIDGTLEKRMRYGKAYNNVRAKTGTISGVSTLSGYLKNSSSNMLAFSIFIQNYSGSAKLARSIQDKICNILAE